MQGRTRGAAEENKHGLREVRVRDAQEGRRREAQEEGGTCEAGVRQVGRWVGLGRAGPVWGWTLRSEEGRGARGRLVTEDRGLHVGAG